MTVEPRKGGETGPPRNGREESAPGPRPGACGYSSDARATPRRALQRRIDRGGVFALELGDVIGDRLDRLDRADALPRTPDVAPGLG